MPEDCRESSSPSIMKKKSVFKTRIRSPKPQKRLEVPAEPQHLTLNVRGYDNDIVIRSADFQADISICGCNNTIIVEEETLSLLPVYIQIGDDQTPVFGCTLHIGRRCNLTATDIRLFDRGSSIDIGDDCLISWDVKIWSSDTHSLLDAEGRVRAGKALHIGNHVWVGNNVRIGKNSFIADDCVIGWGSTIAGRFETPACVIAGAPAQIVREGVKWDARRPDELLPERAEDMARYADWAEQISSKKRRLNLFETAIKALFHHS